AHPIPLQPSITFWISQIAARRAFARRDQQVCKTFGPATQATTGWAARLAPPERRSSCPAREARESPFRLILRRGDRRASQSQAPRVEGESRKYSITPARISSSDL